MNGKIFVEQLKQGWMQVLSWGFGLGLLTFFMSILVADPETLQGYSSIIAALPPQMLGAFGISDAALLTTPEGFLVFAGFTYGAIILSVYGVLSGLNITANDEDSGMMNIILSLPTPRWQVIVERFLATILLLALVVLMFFGGIFVGALVFDLDINLMALFMASFNLMPMTLSIIAVTTLIASIFSNKLIVTALSGAFVIMSYAVHTVVSAINVDEVPLAGLAGKFSIFNYLGSETVVLDETFNIGNIMLLLLVSLVAVAISVFAFENRDISG